MTEGEDSSLKESYSKHEVYFTHLLKLVPEDFYVEPTEDESSGVKKKSRKKKKRKNLSEEDSESEIKTRTTRIEELREKLSKKIKLLQDKRQADKNSREVLTLNRQAKRLKKKIYRAKSKQNKKEKDAASDPSKKNHPDAARTKQTGIYNKEGKMVFSKFDFKDTVEKRPKKKGKRNVAKLIEKINKDKEKLADIKESDPEKAKELEEKISWKTAIDKAQGVKVKDNPVLLNRTMKRQEKIKKKSEKQWKERQNSLDKKMQEKQAKRKTNIQKRKQTRIDRKIKKAKKKGRMIPGF